MAWNYGTFSYQVDISNIQISSELDKPFEHTDVNDNDLPTPSESDSEGTYNTISPSKCQKIGDDMYKVEHYT